MPRRRLTSSNLGSVRSAGPNRRVVHKLRALAVPAEHDFGVGAPARGRRDQVRHRGRARCVAAGQEPGHVGGVGHALDGELAGAADAGGDLVEEERADGGWVADVALLAGTAGVDLEGVRRWVW